MYPFTKEQIRQIVLSEKLPRDWSPSGFKKYVVKEVDEKKSARPTVSMEGRWMLDLASRQLVQLRFFVKAGIVSDATTYDDSLILENQRVRGVGYSLVERRRFYKVCVPRGWHENLDDPNLPPNDEASNIHKPLPDFSPTDLIDFTRQVARMWNIVLPSDDLI
jgi:hypothetical protein